MQLYYVRNKEQCPTVIQKGKTLYCVALQRRVVKLRRKIRFQDEHLKAVCESKPNYILYKINTFSSLLISHNT